MSEDQKSWIKALKFSVAVFALIGLILYGVLAYTFITELDLFKKLFIENLRMSFGIPLAGIASFILVFLLEINSGPVEFEFLKFKLKGAAAPITFWVICYVTIVFSIYLLK